MRKIFLAAVLSAMILSACAGKAKQPAEPPASGDIKIGMQTVADEPAEAEGTADTEAATDEATEPATTEETTELSTEPSTEPAEPTEPAVTTEADYPYEPFGAATYMYSTVTLNVRQYPTTEAKIVGQLNPGDGVEAVGRAPGGDWLVINFNGVKAWVYSEYLSAEEPKITEEVSDLPEDYYFKSDSDYYFLVNKEVFLPDDYEIETEFVQGSYELEAVAARHCREMIEAAEKDGIRLKVLSAYRTVEYQKNLFERNVKQRMDDYGMSYDEAVYDVSINIAPPGGSEHNAGLAVDIIDYNHWDTYEEFENTPEFEWLSEHCTEYGFILRYPKGKEDLTGYIYEPWHYRYVGMENAEAVMASGECLEELLGS